MNKIYTGICVRKSKLRPLEGDNCTKTGNWEKLSFQAWTLEEKDDCVKELQKRQKCITYDGNGRATARMYLERIPNRPQRSHVLFVQLPRKLHESVAFETCSYIGRERATNTPVVEETALQEFAINTQTTLRLCELFLGVVRFIIMCILHEDMQHP